MGQLAKFRGAISGLVIAALLAGPALADPMPLDRALSLGLARSPELGQAQARSGAAEAVKDSAVRQWFPSVDLNGAAGLRHLENDARINLGLSALDERPLYATIGVNQPLWDFGRRTNDARTQRARLASAQQEEEVAGEGAAYAIARAYLQVLVQQRVVQASQDNLAFHQNIAADVSEGVDKGAMSISERQQANERLQGAKLALEQANADLGTARAELGLLVGSDNFEVVAPPDPSGVIPASLDAALALAATNDPRVHSMEYRFRAAQSQARRARSEFWPSVGLQGTIRAGKDFEGYAGTTRDYELLLVARWNLFNGGVTSARIREADHNADEARFALGGAQRDSELQVRKAWIGLQSWRSRLETQQARLGVAGDVLISYRAQFGIGRRSLLDVLDAQNAVYNASVETEVARTGALLAEYGLLAQLNQLRSFFGISKATIDPKLYGPQ